MVRRSSAGKKSGANMYFLHKKLRIWGSTESFLKLSDSDSSEFLTSFLKAS